MIDKTRLDAIDEFGLLVAPQEQLTADGPVRIWVCQYYGRTAVGGSVREVIDLAILDLNASCLLQQH